MFKESILIKVIFIFLVLIFLSSIFGLIVLKNYCKIGAEKKDQYIKCSESLGAASNKNLCKKFLNQYEKK